MERDTDTRSSDQINLSGIAINQITSKSGEPISLTLTSSKSASLPASELVPEITIRDEEHGISIEYIEGARTREAVELLFKRLAQKSVPAKTPLPGTQLQRITIEALRQAPLAENEFVLSWQEQTEAYLFFFPDKHFVQGHAKVVTISKVSVQEADSIILQQLAQTNIHSVQSTLQVKEAEVEPSHKLIVEVDKKPDETLVISEPPKPVLPLLGLHEELEKVGAYDKLKEQRDRDVLKAWLTSEAPQSDFMRETGITTPQGVNKLVHRTLSEIFADLPSKIQEQYGGSAKEAIKRKTATQLQTNISRERIKNGVAGKEKVFTKPRGRPKGIVEEQPRKYKERAGRPKGSKDSHPTANRGRPKGRPDSQPRKARELSDTHKQHMSESLKRYHQEQKVQQQIPPHEEHTIFVPKKPLQ